MGFFNKLRDMKDSVSYKLDEVKYFVVDKAEDAKDFITEKVKIKSKADVVELTSNLLKSHYLINVSK
ncbi:hypothetical protein [Peribacillus butanolivorans]|uniref:hypothetical protein n=1 Tax=Peribacillus butanolivorans TaxID=421767 RepID=UPI0036770D89